MEVLEFHSLQGPVAQSGSAPRSHRGGLGFKSPQVHRSAVLEFAQDRLTRSRPITLIGRDLGVSGVFGRSGCWRGPCSGVVRSGPARFWAGAGTPRGPTASGGWWVCLFAGSACQGEAGGGGRLPRPVCDRWPSPKLRDAVSIASKSSSVRVAPARSSSHVSRVVRLATVSMSAMRRVWVTCPVAGRCLGLPMSRSSLLKRPLAPSLWLRMGL